MLLRNTSVDESRKLKALVVSPNLIGLLKRGLERLALLETNEKREEIRG